MKEIKRWEVGDGYGTYVCDDGDWVAYVDHEEEVNKIQSSYNAVISYMLGKGYMEEPLQFLRCWNEGNFEALREEWPDAPEEIYLADPLYKGNKQ